MSFWLRYFNLIDALLVLSVESFNNITGLDRMEENISNGRGWCQDLALKLINWKFLDPCQRIDTGEMWLDSGKRLFVIFQVPNLDETVAGPSCNVVRLWREHDAIDRDRLDSLNRTSGMKRCLKHLVIRSGCIYQYNPAILSTTCNYFIWHNELFTCMVDMNAVDNSLVRVVESSGLTRLQQVQCDYFTTCYHLRWLHWFFRTIILKLTFYYTINSKN